MTSNAEIPEWPRAHPEFGPALHQHPYYRANGELVGFNCDFDHGGMHKEVPLTINGNGWEWGHELSTPTPLYNVQELAVYPDWPVVLTGTEDAAHAAAALLGGHVGVSWLGGREGAKTADWSALANRHVLLWPAAGIAPQQAADRAQRRAREAGAAVKRVAPPDGVPDGWDATAAATEGWGTADVTDWLIARKVGEPHVIRPKKRGKKARGPIPGADGDYAETMQAEESAAAPQSEPREWPFLSLGHYRGVHFYLPNSGGTIITLSAACHVPRWLYELAPLNFWETQFGCKEKAGWDAAANTLIQSSLRVGVYDQSRLRGRGAWWDEGRVVVHLGDRLIVDGIVTPIRHHQSKYLYEVGAEIRFAEAKALTNVQAVRLLELTKMLSWERSLSAYLLAGWIALAPICGALKWRPHIFLTGQAQSGKSHVYQHIIVRCIGNAGLALASSVTEPGIRRALGSDALPVMIDELEAKDERGVMRIEGIMGLMRYSSSETDAVIVKGSQGGGGVDMFRIRSMFCTCAIGSLISDYADATRNSTISLKAVSGRAGAAKFAAIEEAEREILTDPWIDGLHSRIVGLIPIIRHNAEVFAIAGAKVLDARRLGDQIGTLLAGAYALTSTRKITPEEATAWLEAQDWTEEREITTDTDGPMCLAKILEHQVNVEAPRGMLRRSLGELVMLSRHTMIDDPMITSEIATATLKRHGIMPMPNGYIAISNTHSEIAQILYNTPWSSNWARRLKVIPDALSGDAPMSFGAAKTVSRVVLVRV